MVQYTKNPPPKALSEHHLWQGFWLFLLKYVSSSSGERFSSGDLGGWSAGAPQLLNSAHKLGEDPGLFVRVTVVVIVRQRKGRGFRQAFRGDSPDNLFDFRQWHETWVPRVVSDHQATGIDAYDLRHPLKGNSKPYLAHPVAWPGFGFWDQLDGTHMN